MIDFNDTIVLQFYISCALIFLMGVIVGATGRFLWHRRRGSKVRPSLRTNTRSGSVFYALLGAVALIPGGSAFAQITTTTTTTLTYDFPDSEPVVSTSTSTLNSCPPVYYSSGGYGGGGGSEPTSFADMNGDGISDTSVSASVGSAVGHGSTTSGIGQSTGSGGGGGGKVLCTYFYLKGMLPEDIYLADSLYSRVKVSDCVRSGYHAWAVPLVAKLHSGNHPLLERIIYPLVRGWAYEMAYVMGVSDRHDPVGFILRLAGEPLCGLIGRYLHARGEDSSFKNYSSCFSKKSECRKPI